MLGALGKAVVVCHGPHISLYSKRMAGSRTLTLFATVIRAAFGVHQGHVLPVKRLKQLANVPSPLIWASRLRTGGTELAGNTREVPHLRSPSLITSRWNHSMLCLQTVDHFQCPVRRQVVDPGREIVPWQTPECLRSNHRRYGHKGSKSPLACHGTSEGRQHILAYGNMD